MQMKAINILSLVQAKRDLCDENFQHYIANFQLNPRIRPTEIADCATLIEELMQIGAKSHHFNEFFVGYAIQQISKEFDLLRIGDDFLLNIELKLEGTKDRIEKQLIQNAHYLRFLNKPLYSFTFVTQTKTLYKLQNGQLQRAPLYELFNLLEQQCVTYDVAIDDLFDPVNYLVSPIDEPLPFMNDEYFLTAQQTTFKIEIMNAAMRLRKWLAIKGGPGTGKTLLTYDIAKTYQQAGYLVCVLHTRPLQAGQKTLNTHFGWYIAHIDEPFEHEPFDIIIVDEAQNLEPAHIARLLEYEVRHESKIIISYDPQLYFNGAPIIAYIEQFVKLEQFELKVIIRYNKEIQTFINCLFDLHYEHHYPTFQHVSVHYFSYIYEAKQYVESLQQKNWRIINVLHELSQGKQSATKDIIGQEFDCVAAIMDEHFFYKENGRLSCSGLKPITEQPTKILFQALTRARKRLQIIVVGNEQVLQNMLAILAMNQNKAMYK